MIIGVIAFIVFMERAHRRVVVQYPKRQVGANQMAGGDSSHIPLKLNTSGVIPPIFASSLLLLPLTIVGFSGAEGGDISATLARWLQHGQPTYMILYGALILFFTFFYTAIVFNPKENAETLRKYGGHFKIRPGKHTGSPGLYPHAHYGDWRRLFGVHLSASRVLISRYNMPFYFGGRAAIVVSVTMDTIQQIHSHMIAHQYEGLMKKSRLR